MDLLLQQWFKSSDPAAEEALWTRPRCARIAGIDLSAESAPDETTIFTVRRVLERDTLDVTVRLVQR